MPAVCSAFDAHKFYAATGVALTRRSGPKFGATAEWTLAL